MIAFLAIFGALAILDLAGIVLFALVALAIRLLSPRPEPHVPIAWVEHMAHLNPPAVWRRDPMRRRQRIEVIDV